MADLASYRTSLLRHLHETSRELLFMTDPPKNMPKIVEALHSILVSWQEFTEAISTSNTGYEMRDLPRDEQVLLKETRHALKMLDHVYVEPTRPQPG